MAINEIPGDLKFLKSHEWARVEDDGSVTVGISDHAQGQLGDLVYVELPAVGDAVELGNACAVVAGRGCADAAASLVGGHGVETDAGAAELERSGALQALGLDVDVIVERQPQERRADGNTVEPPRGGFDVVEGYGKCRGGHAPDRIPGRPHRIPSARGDGRTDPG